MKGFLIGLVVLICTTNVVQAKVITTVSRTLKGELPTYLDLSGEATIAVFKQTPTSSFPIISDYVEWEVNNLCCVGQLAVLDSTSSIWSDFVSNLTIGLSDYYISMESKLDSYGSKTVQPLSFLFTDLSFDNLATEYTVDSNIMSFNGHAVEKLELPVTEMSRIDLLDGNYNYRFGYNLAVHGTPEPSTLLMFLLGTVLYIRVRR